MKKIYYSLILLVSALVYASCTPEVDDLFKESASQRIQSAITETQKILVSSPNGWLLSMYGNLDYGGYNVICKFDAQNNVTVYSEIAGDGKPASSHYDVIQSAGVLLSFDEYNPVMHYFSTPDNPDFGRKGLGFGGDLEFRVMKATKDSVVMLGKKTGLHLVMTPFKGGTPKEFFEKVQQMEKNLSMTMYTLKTETLTDTLSRSDRCLTGFDPETGKSVRFPYVVTPEGMRFYKPIKFAGKVFTGVNYAENEVLPDIKDNTISLTPLILPLNEQIIRSLWYATYDNIGKFAKPYIEAAMAGSEAMGYPLNYLFLGTYDLDGDSRQFEPTFGLTFQGGNWWGTYQYNYKMVGKDEIILEFAFYGLLNANWYYNNCKYFNLLIPFGKEKEPHHFKLTADNLATPSYIIMTDMDNPDNVIKLTATPTRFK